MDVQWGLWRNPVQQGRADTFRRAVPAALSGFGGPPKCLRVNDPLARGPLNYGAQVGGMANRHLQTLRVAARAALGSGASLELAIHGGWRPLAQAFNLLRGPAPSNRKAVALPPRRCGITTFDQISGALCVFSLSLSLSLCLSLSLFLSFYWHPCAHGWRTPMSDLTWPEAVATIQQNQFQLCFGASRGPAPIDPVDFRNWRRWASGTTPAKRAAVNVAPGGAWVDQRCSDFCGEPTCSLCGGTAGH